MTAPEFPPLPEPLTMSLLASSSDREFTADQMREYAMLERLAERERNLDLLAGCMKIAKRHASRADDCGALARAVALAVSAIRSQGELTTD